MNRRKLPPGAVLGKGCGFCGAAAGEPCVLTLAPELPRLSVQWSHRTREEAARG